MRDMTTLTMRKGRYARPICYVTSVHLPKVKEQMWQYASG
jgi:hypothetical protein